MTASSLNFTERRRIKLNFVDVHLLERSENYIRVRVAVDEKVLSFGQDYRLVIDAMDRGRHQRHLIDNPAGEDLDFTGFPIDASLRFRVRQVATGEEEGKVLAATADIRPVEIESNVEREPFLVPEIEDLGPLPWRIDWEGDVANPRIVLNSRLEDHFGGTWRHPGLQALFLPAMLRDLLTGLICRVPSYEELDDETLGSRIMEFCKDRFEVTVPSGSFRSFEGVNEDWLKWAEDCVVQFSETKWRKGSTLFDQMLEASE
jgi:hypothetical protein